MTDEIERKIKLPVDKVLQVVADAVKHNEKEIELSFGRVKNEYIWLMMYPVKVIGDNELQRQDKEVVKV